MDAALRAKHNTAVPMSLADYCEVNRMNDLLTQWDSKKNTDLSPKTVSCGSCLGITILQRSGLI